MKKTITSVSHVSLLVIFLTLVTFGVTTQVTAAISYPGLDYSEHLPTDGSSVTGSLVTKTIYPDENAGFGKGYSFNARRGNRYIITCIYTVAQEIPLYGRLYLLSEDVQRFYSRDDVIEQSSNDTLGTELTVTLAYVAFADEEFRLLLCEFLGEDVGYSIKIEETDAPTLYTSIAYPGIATVVTPAGTLSPDNNLLVDPHGNIVSGTGYSFSVRSGKMYSITCTYTAAQEIEFNGKLYLLTGDSLQGDYGKDVINIFEKTATGTKTTLTLDYAAFKSGNIRVLLVNDSGEEINYSIEIETKDVSILSYTKVAYPAITFNTAPITGTLSPANNWIVDPDGSFASGTGYSSGVQKGKRYIITCTFTSTQKTTFDAGFYLLNGGMLQGDYYDDVVTKTVKNTTGTEITVTLDDIAPESGDMRILLVGYGGREINYSVKIEEIDAPPSYTTIDYPAITTDGIPTTGTLSSENNLIAPFRDITPGMGYRFKAKEGKKYTITCTYTLKYETEFTGGFLLLTDELQVDYDNIVENKKTTDDEIIVTYNYTAFQSGDVHILLFGTSEEEFNYSIKIEETDVPPLYTTIAYPTIIIDGTPTTGTVSPADNLITSLYGKITIGTGYSFSAKSGKMYTITIAYTSTEETDFYGGFYLLTGGVLQGSYDEDVISESQSSGTDTEMICTLDYIAFTSDNLRILMYCDIDSGKEISYSIKIEETDMPPSYTAIAYPAILADSEPVTGALSAANNYIFNPYNVTTPGTGYSFSAQKGKKYTITYTVTSTKRIPFSSRIFLLTGNPLQGDYGKDVIKSTTKPIIFDTEMTLTLDYIAFSSEDLRVLLINYSKEEFGYSIKIEETDAPPSYTTITYPVIAVNTAWITTGTLSSGNWIKTPDDNLVFGAGYSFSAQNEKMYTITCTFTSTEELDFSGGFYLLTGDSLQGNYEDIRYKKENDTSGTEMVLTLDYSPLKSGNLRILLFDYSAKNMDYSITIEEVDAPPLYTLIAYPAITVNTEPVTGSLSPENNTIVNPSGNIASSKGYRFSVESGKRYTISCNYTAPQEMEFNSGFYLLNGSMLQGDFDKDVISINESDITGVETTVSLDYTASTSGDLRILLCDFSGGKMSYSIEVKETDTSSFNTIQKNPVIVYAQDRNIIVRNAEPGSRLRIMDIAGKTVVNTIVQSTETIVPVASGGIYIVKTGTQTVKVICR